MDDPFGSALRHQHEVGPAWAPADDRQAETAPLRRRRAQRVDAGLSTAARGAVDPSGPPPDRVVIINDFSIARGGATILALAAAQGAAARGAPTTFICGDAGPCGGLEGVDFVALAGEELTERATLASGITGLWNPRCSLIAQWIARNDTPGTVYHLHNWTKILSPSVFSALRSVRRRLVLHCHDFALACPTSTFYDNSLDQTCGRQPLSAPCLASNCDKHSRIHKAWRTVRFLLFNGASDIRRGPSRLLVLCDGMRPFLRRAGFPDGLMITVRNPSIPYVARRVEAEKRRELLFVGRVAPEKGVEDVAAAATAIGATLRVMGDGPLRARLSERFPNVVMEGWADRKALTEAARRSRLLVVPSQWTEPFGMVFTEAASAGLPVVFSSQSILAPELIQRGVGWAVNAGDLPDLTQLLRRLMGDDQAIGAASRAGYAARGELARTPESWADQLMEIYRSLAATGRRTSSPGL